MAYEERKQLQHGQPAGLEVEGLMQAGPDHIDVVEGDVAVDVAAVVAVVAADAVAVAVAVVVVVAVVVILAALEAPSSAACSLFTHDFPTSDFSYKNCKF